MENTKNKNSTIQPLPGVRQGTSGASAGRDSLQTASGALLNRRTCTGEPETSTAEPSSSKSQVTPVTSTNDLPVESALPISQPTTTKAGKPRQRMIWSNQMNENLMRCYYTVTENETTTVGYRELLHKKFIEQYPDLSHLTEQRIADQKRVIINNKRLDLATLEKIRTEVESRTTKNETITLPIPPLNIDVGERDTEITTQIVNTPTDIQQNTKQPEDNTLNIPLLQQVQEGFQKALLEFENTDPTLRHIIPKQNTSRKFAEIINIINKHVLVDYIKTHHTFPEIHTAIYCAAVAAVRTNGGRTRPQYANSIKPESIPPWKKRLHQRIEKLRKDIGRLTQYAKGNNSKRLTTHVHKIMHNHSQHSKYEKDNKTPNEYIDTLKQKLAALSKRLKRYNVTTKRKQQNSLFVNNEKQFYTNLCKKNTTENNGVPSRESIKDYWSSVWSNEVYHDDKAEFIKESENNQNIPEMTYENITENEFTEVIKTLHNWKTPGVDQIHNYFYKQFTCIHSYLVEHLQHFIRNPDSMPCFLTQGITYLKPKDDDTQNPAKYRPITCLPALYKIITSLIARKIYQHCEENSILAEEQKGCRKLSQGCKEQLTIDAVIMKQACRKMRNLYTAFIDYRKAFDSVPHSWLKHVLELYKIHPILKNFLSYTMTTWQTTLKLSTNNSQVATGTIKIKRGIFQGDSLSPLWFCLALNPLSQFLNNTPYGFNIKHQKNTLYKLSHLMYVDDIKLYAATQEELQKLLTLVYTFSQNIRMEFGLEKCKTQTIIKGSSSALDINLEHDVKIEALQEGETYKYLGYEQSRCIHHRETKESITKAFTSRLNVITKTKLNGKNIIKAINTYAIPILTYSFGIVDWSQTDLKNLQTKINTILTRNRQQHPKSAIERAILPRREGGKGLIDINAQHNLQINKMRTYFTNKANTSRLHSAIVHADNKYTPLNLQTQDYQLTARTVEDLIQTWKQKALHGRYPNEVSQPHVDKGASYAWLTHSGLYPETEGFIMAIQDQVINTRNYRKHILKDVTARNDTCRRCNEATETIQHITSACKSLTQTDYKYRHDQISAIIHQKLAKTNNLLKQTTPYYKYTPSTILENETHRMYWDRTIITDKTIHHNRPDITLIDKKNRITYLIDVAVPNTHNIQSTHAEKISKYTDLAIELKTMWKMDKVIIVPIILSATGVVPKTLKHGITSLKLPAGTYLELQKAAILNTCRIVRKFLDTDITNSSQYAQYTSLQT